ncbi:hypothetical protein [Kibdelosporangium aridum]|uniref:hypothetical protein n=1 Tax=Kibdelosporangium aridum TaxID=2030 RepID=UPI000524995E
MNQTYDPIEETVELRRLRVGSPLRTPGMGSVLVLERSVGAPMVIGPGERIPERRLGNYTRMHVVNTRPKALSFTTDAPSVDPAFTFQVTVSFGCQVTDPVAIARDGVRDMTAALVPSLTAIIRSVACQYDVLDPAPVEAEIGTRLNGAYPVSAVRLSGFSVQVTPADTTEIVTAQREIRVQGMYRDAMRPVAKGGREEMLAHVMGLTGGDPTPWLDREQKAKDQQVQASLDALRALMNSGEPLPQFNTSQISEQAMESFFPGSLNGSKRGGIRDRIARKTRGVIEGNSVVEGDSAAKPDDADDAAAAKADEKPESTAKNGNDQSRLRGTAKQTGDK